MLTIKKWAEEDRPREKLLLKGPSALSDAELLAILIGSGNAEESAVQVAQHILRAANQNLYELGKMSIAQLKADFKGIGEAKAVTIAAAMELARRLNGKYIAPESKHLTKRVQEIANGDFKSLMENIMQKPLEEMKELYNNREIEK